MKAIYFLIYCSIGYLSGFWMLINPADAAGPSFDCAKAMTRAEKAICQDGQLGDLDATLLTTLRAALEKTPAARDQLLSEERQWVRDRDHACVPANASPPQTTNIVGCLRDRYQKRIEVLQLAQLQPAAEAPEDASKAACHKIVDRYKALVEADPEAPFRKYDRFAQSPIELLAENKSTGVVIEPEILLEDFDKDPEGSMLAQLRRETPTIKLSESVSKAISDFGKVAGSYSVRFSHLSGIDLFRLSSVQGTLGCYHDVFFRIKQGLAKVIEPAEGWTDCGGASQEMGEVDGAPFAFIYNDTPMKGTSYSEVMRWKGDKFVPSCTIHFEYAPRFILRSPYHEKDESCKRPNCDALRQGALHLAEFVNSNQTDTQKGLTEKLLPSQRRDFDILKEKSKLAHPKPDHYTNPEMTEANPLLLPFVFDNQLYLARIGHFTLGWRTYPDWSVVLEQRDRDTVVEVASFAIGMTNGKLLKANVQ